MSFDKPDAPTQPDPTATTNAQFGLNKNTLNFLSGLNAPNINTPFGSVNYTKDASGAVTGQNVTLDPQQQQILDQQRQFGIGVAGKANGMLGNLPQGTFDLSQLGMKMPGQEDYGAYANQVSQANFDKARGLLDPVFSQQNRNLTQSLADRGQPTTGEGAQTETGNMFRAQNNAYTDAANNSVIAGGNALAQLSGVQNQDYNTALNANLQQRNQPYQELGGLLGLQPNTPYQNQQPTGQLGVTPPDFQGATQNQYQGLLNNYNNQMNAYNNTWNTVGQVAGQATKLAAGGF